MEYEHREVKGKLLPAVRVGDDLWFKVIKLAQEHKVPIGEVIRTALREHLIKDEHHDND